MAASLDSKISQALAAYEELQVIALNVEESTDRAFTRVLDPLCDICREKLLKKAELDYKMEGFEEALECYKTSLYNMPNSEAIAYYMNRLDGDFSQVASDYLQAYKSEIAEKYGVVA